MLTTSYRLVSAKSKAGAKRSRANLKQHEKSRAFSAGCTIENHCCSVNSSGSLNVFVKTLPSNNTNRCFLGCPL